jgi:hypothetical protein
VPRREKKGKKMKTCNHFAYVVVFDDKECPACKLQMKSCDFDNVLRWAIDRYKEQVSQRPDVNKYKRTLHEVWTQVIEKIKKQNDDSKNILAEYEDEAKKPEAHPCAERPPQDTAEAGSTYV